MSSEEKRLIILAIRAYTEEACRSQTAARNALESSGIYLKDGTLSPSYEKAR